MVVRAPGKLVIVGEYAVLDGAPAVVCAVDRGVAVSYTRGPTLELVTPGDDTFARAALDAEGAPPGTYTFADWNPVASTTKVGLGGSAAAVVAATLAASVALGAPHPPAVLAARAHAVHRAVQGGGSGVDVAASAHGGLLRFERGSVTALPETAVRHLVVVAAGAPAATAPRVAAYRAWGPREPFVAASEAIVDGFARDPVHALREAWGRLCAMADRAGIAYRTPAIDALVGSAVAAGGGAKPSGAGGGDIVIAVFADEGAARGWAASTARAGFLVVPVAASVGAHVVDPLVA